MQTEAWAWVAHYSDGEEWAEHDPETGEPRGFASIDLARLAVLELVPRQPGLSPVCVQVDPTTALRPIFFRRRKLTYQMGSGQTIHNATIHCLGWAKTVAGHSVKSFLFLFEDGSLLLSDDLDAV